MYIDFLVSRSYSELTCTILSFHDSLLMHGIGRSHRIFAREKDPFTFLNSFRMWRKQKKNWSWYGGILIKTGQQDSVAVRKCYWILKTCVHLLLCSKQIHIEHLPQWPYLTLHIASIWRKIETKRNDVFQTIKHSIVFGPKMKEIIMENNFDFVITAQKSRIYL